MTAESYAWLDLGDGVKVAVAATDFGGGSLVSASDVVAPLSKLIGPIETISKAVMNALKKAEPTSFTVELDFSVGISSGGFTMAFGRATGTAAVKATLTWSKAEG